MDINVNLYKCFVKVYETQNITRASELLFISQPAISYNLKQLEKQLGVTLFKKHPRGVIPTAQADIVYRYTTQAFNTILAGENSLLDYTNLKKGTIRIGCPSHIASTFLSKFLVYFNKLNPDIKIIISSNYRHGMLEKMHLKDIDFILDFLPYQTRDYKNVCVDKLLSLGSCIFASPKIAKKIQYCNQSNFSKIPFVIQSMDSSNIELLRSTTKGQSLNVLMETWATETMVSVVEQGLGVGFCCESIIKDKLQNLSLTKLSTDIPLPSLDLGCIYFSDTLSPLNEKFIEMFKSYLKESK